MRRTYHHRPIIVRHWSPWSSAIKANVHEPKPLARSPPPLVAQHHTASSQERGRREKQGGEGSRSGEDLARARSATPISYSDVAAWHGTASPHHGLASPPHRHEPYGEPRRSPLTALAVLAMNATAFPHLGDTEAEHSCSWTRCTRTARAQDQGLAAPTPSGSGTPARPPCTPWPRAQPW